ncbi:calcium-binding protein [Antarcticirhabdus aurantiaca]|uniref:Calcium-binding protein n=1 Tax=Antarcticirhabdus aurantiaca TaxID=2606717 RepID=A0ACD4NMH1_9HYPH|nr:calcium-binding protein [Antarcticirhabdus aurantiaca]WAJ27875.1 calcium-binding protein [Jeongeuplla avenae]
MPVSTSYTFFGVVEDAFDGEFLRIDPQAFGYAARQTITGSLALSGSLAALWSSLPEAERVLSTNDISELDLSFAQESTGNWTEADLVTPLTLVSTRDERPLDQLSATLFHSDQPDGPTLRLDQLEHGGALLTNDDDRSAYVYGAWVPDEVKPTLVYGTSVENRMSLTGELTLAWGGRGEDTIRVMDGQAFVWGQQGDDRITGGDGRDVLYGGIGDDTIRGQGGDDVIRGDWGDDILKGGAGNDRISGGAGDDLIEGNGGADILDAGGGVDIVRGGAGDDVILSGTGRFDESFELERSISEGGSGNDTIIATFDAILTGGSGADIFQVGNPAGVLDNIGGLNITDFRPGVDKLAVYAGEPGQYDSFEEIMARATEISGDLVFDFFPTSTKDLPSLVLENVKASQLTSGDFLWDDFLV